MRGLDGYRCSTCGVTWHPVIENKRCMQCGEKTDPCRDVSPTMTASEEQSIRNHVTFEKAYEIHDRNRNGTDGLVPTVERERFTLEKWRAQPKSVR